MTYDVYIYMLKYIQTHRECNVSRKKIYTIQYHYISLMDTGPPQHWRSSPVPSSSARCFGETCARRQAAC